MAILKIKDETGKFVGIPAIQGPPGKDGAIQYVAGDGIKIEDNVITADIPVSAIITITPNDGEDHIAVNDGGVPAKKWVLVSPGVTLGYRDADGNFKSFGDPFNSRDKLERIRMVCFQVTDEFLTYPYNKYANIITFSNQFGSSSCAMLDNYITNAKGFSFSSSPYAKFNGQFVTTGYLSGTVIKNDLTTTTNDSSSALSAYQGKVLNDKITELRQYVDDSITTALEGEY